MTVRLAAFARLWTDQVTHRIPVSVRFLLVNSGTATPLLHLCTPKALFLLLPSSFLDLLAPRVTDQLSTGRDHASRDEAHRSGFAMPTRQAWVYRPSSIRNPATQRPLPPVRLVYPLFLTRAHEHRAHEAPSALQRRRRMRGIPLEQRNLVFRTTGGSRHCQLVPRAALFRSDQARNYRRISAGGKQAVCQPYKGEFTLSRRRRGRLRAGTEAQIRDQSVRRLVGRASKTGRTTARSLGLRETTPPT
ncbi:hypothetical protein EDB86DRAFT_1607351 [Lactarius hatsudake]|nr:hypothetical protein EDB86DRAFT_1607351 [Lactarius hatsudake]